MSVVVSLTPPLVVINGGRLLRELRPRADDPPLEALLEPLLKALLKAVELAEI